MRRLVSVMIVLGLVAALEVAQAQHQHGSQQEHQPAEHSFADIERYVKIFESPERDRWQKPNEVVAALGVQPGMVVADVGAGTGYFSRRFAGAVGPKGTVFASDLEPNMVVYLRERAEKEGLANLIPVLASTDDPRLPDGLSDLVFLCNTWHHIHDRVAYARRLRDDLAPGGRVAIVDFLPGDLPVGPPPEHRMSAEEITSEFKRAGYRLTTSVKDLLPYQYILIFTAQD